ncbi:MAG: acyl-CoA dehydratase activase-related protein [Eubacteriales bacterium]|nr:acyl-CoA dehydratase activase-related protein [Eubacteriales bacterium]
MTKTGEYVLGIPRALLYYRYDRMWQVFFEELGIQTRLSPPTDRKIYEAGAARAIDEMCLSAKIFLGHVDALIGTCDAILIPRIHDFGHRREMCLTFSALYDMTANVFRGSGQQFLALNIDEKKGTDEKSGYLNLAASLGCSASAASKAYKKAKKAEEASWKSKMREQEELYKRPGKKVLLAGHSYVIEDPYFGKPILEYLKKLGVTAVRADVVDRKDALKQSGKVSPTLKWEMNREIVGGLYLNRKKIDGVILLSVFPCGPDSMVNDLLMRKNEGIPTLNLMLDGQSGMAGVETRLESFVDILNFKGGSV